MMTGKDYPHLCETCQAAIDGAAMLFGEDGPDTDNEEAACDYVYDHHLFCGGHTCVNRPSHDKECSDVSEGGHLPPDKDFDELADMTAEEVEDYYREHWRRSKP